METEKSIQLADPCALFTNRVRFQLMRDCAQQSTPEKLERVLREALKPNNAFTSSLLNEVVYLVLSHPPATARRGQRHFVAAINWQRVDPQTKTYLKNTSAIDQSADATEECEVFLVNECGEERTVMGAAQTLWARKWAEYWTITKQGVDQHEWFTWNHLLMKPGVEPLPMGLCWDFDWQQDAGSSYFQLSPRLAEGIGLGCLGKPNSISSLLRMAAHEIYRHDLQTIDRGDVAPLLNLCNEMDRSGSQQRDAAAIGWKVFNLVRSYAIWGGKAFISIPLVIGTAEATNTAVLSVCSTAPLSFARLRDWRATADALLRPLAEEELISLIREHGFAAAAYRVNHSLMHRFNQVSGLTRTAYKRAEELDERITELENADVSGPLLKLSKDLVESMYVVYTSAEASRRVTELMHFIGTMRKTECGDQPDKRFLATEPYLFADHLPSVQAGIPLPFTRYVGGELRSVIVEQADLMAFSSRQIRIEPFKNAWGVSRPFDSLYDELLFELLLNSVRHGFTDPTVLHISVSSDSEGRSCIEFANLGPRGGLPSKIALDCWQLWDVTRRGGLGCLAECLSITGSGSLSCRFQYSGPYPRFTARLCLSGLAYNNATSSCQ